MVASKNRDIREAVECVVFSPSNFEESLLEALEDALGDQAVRRVDRIDDLGGPSIHRRLVLYRQGHAIPELNELFRTVRRHADVDSTVCVVDDGDWKAANSAVRDGASGYLFVEQFDSPHLASHLRASLECGLAAERRSSLQRELEERSSELLGLNALANGVSSSLDREVITRRGLWVFAGVCQKTAVCLLELDPLPELQNVSDGDDGDPPELQCAATFSARGLDDFCGPIPCDESWRNIIFDNHTAVIEGRPDGDEFPGLERFWNEHPEGQVTILPLHANRRPYGALVMVDINDVPSDAKISREGMRAMALQFASALENARLFEEVKEAYESLQETQDQLVHAEKFAAVGVLAAEIAHEINNPASFVISNLSVMVEYAETIADYLDAVEDLVGEEAEGLIEEFDELKEEFEIEFLREDMEHLLSRSLSGMQRIHQVVQDLRYLSRDSGEDPGWVEIESLLDATVNLVRHEAKFRADIVRDFDGAPQVMSDAGRLSQVFLNLMVNAVQAIESGDIEDNHVRVATETLDEAVRVIVEDTGSGIPEEDRDRIFDPFFSTKETGEGTGLGLSISHNIVRSLGAEIDFETELDEGTTFFVTIPIRAAKFAEDEDLRDSGYYEMPPELSEAPDETADS